MSYSRMLSSGPSYCIIWPHIYLYVRVLSYAHYNYIHYICKQIIILKAVAALHKLPVAPINYKYKYGCVMCVMTFSSPYCSEHS